MKTNLDEKLDISNFSVRVWDGIKRLNLITINDLIDIISTENNLKKTFGENSLEEIYCFLKEKNISRDKIPKKELSIRREILSSYTIINN